MEATKVTFFTREATNIDAKTAHAATFLKFAALASATLTLAVAAIVLSWQARAWILTGEWSPFPISRVLALAGLDEIRATTTAPRIFDWGINLPASGFLLAVAAILIAFSVLAASVEEQFGKK
jgi:hypothetical protein